MHNRQINTYKAKKTAFSSSPNKIPRKNRRNSSYRQMKFLTNVLYFVVLYLEFHVLF